MGVVYKVTNTIDGVSYIGATRSTMSRRRSQHYCHAKKGRKSQFWAALRQHSANVFVWREIVRNVPDDKLARVEAKEIVRARKRGETLYNVDKVIFVGEEIFC